MDLEWIFIDTGLGPFLAWFMPALIIGTLIWQEIRRRLRATHIAEEKRHQSHRHKRNI